MTQFIFFEKVQYMAKNVDNSTEVLYKLFNIPAMLTGFYLVNPYPANVENRVS
jgi:hypothetical protein